MPAVRDITWNYTTATTGTTIVIATPAVEVNDLMLAIITADTGTATWTSTGWTVLFSQTNTCQQVMLYKIAVLADTTTENYTFTATTGETFNGCIISVRDVNTSNPFGNPVVRTTSTQAAAAKYQMTSVTTNVNNSLVLYAVSNSGAGVPSLLEGPVYGLLGADGSAESMGVGWGFQPATGTTPTNVTVSNVATGAGLKTTLQIAPPASGALVIPTYCVSDNSTYINPINGTTAYNGDNALAATADTNFGTSLGGLVAGDATVSAVADVGLNSFHSVGRLTSITGSRNLSGAELVMATANRPNVTGKNLLVHIGPSSEGQTQRFSTASSGRGIWFGMRSGAATNYKIWQVYGVEKGSLRQQPVIINSNALNTKATAGTLDSNAVFSFGFWVAGSGVTTTAWDFCSLWALDTTAICGGNSSFPINLQSITASVANGKERKSVLLQGSSQMQILQPIQIGNGSNATYLNLDSTAIEIPNQYNLDTLDITYNSVDNVAGITYFASAADTIKHTNSVVSSGNDFHWRIHASSSASATYDFNGLSLIGAGDVQLRNVTTFSNIAFTKCTTITQNSATLTSCEFTDSFVISNSPASISGCNFISSGIGYAIEITTPGVYSFSGNTFSGYGASSTANAAIYNNSGGSVTLNISSGGTTPTFSNGVGASTSVVNTIALTITGLQPSSDIVILQAGTNNVIASVDSNIPTSWIYSYDTQQTVDIGIIKPGFIPLYIRNYSLGSSNASLPVAQQFDRNYA